MAENKVDGMEDTDKKEDGVNDVSPELSIKHPLQNTWTLWYLDNDKQKSWEENQKEVTSFQTAEDFWSLYNHIKAASELRQGCDYSLFKKGIRPMWEDEVNKRGGRWLINLEKKQRASDLDNFWLEILLCLIGEAFDEYSSQVCGAVVNIRAKGDKIGLWTSDASNEQSIMKIGHKLKERLKIGRNITISYQSHKDTMAKSGSATKITYSV
ncbi:eukaryotic translation initiation factor 4E-like [Schistocerca americana]|uniref:eukaryotic translation initiation factor 4E-like n=1 Tax=Schistocerca americana TaxID=7009 RepID=UPI001F4FA7D4|nr:eukaryotic translation initiation factor 4E-like [Schistocerca americana]XP_047097579.1 eukaryotic translation initiation factor 4E-like [Schistocerca piceifrons]XP_049766605.1 eukaryotic translation initiation factor 4E-like [Schistocerca cancellata]XP_049793790.1 eukaryotic translation initiation factor 4E-like [Schistocerca nitens]XP_049839494.1 eukaryotic translation initiation factor 4E-like [Schistocerca gregaria]XP_049848324.1 eukaryotic translation initiation factor 4E-like [Schisto